MTLDLPETLDSGVQSLAMAAVMHLWSGAGRRDVDVCSRGVWGYFLGIFGRPLLFVISFQSNRKYGKTTFLGELCPASESSWAVLG